jgi:hypothetical protein
MRSYQPSGIAPVLGILITVIGGTAAALFVGWLLFIFDHYGFFLILIFPAVAAFLVGFVVSQMIKVGKIRNPKVGAGLGIAAGLIVIASYFGFGYTIGFKNDVQELIQTIGAEGDSDISTLNQAGLTDTLAARAEDAFLQSYVGTTGFLGYLNFKAKEGTSVGIRRLTLFNISGIFYWILKLIEMGIVLLGVYALAESAANEPFDEHNQQWYGEKTILFSSDADIASVNKALRQGDFENAALQLSSPSAAAPYIVLSSRTVKNGKPSKIVLELDEVTLDSKDKETSKMFERGLVSAEQLDRLMVAKVSTNVVQAKPVVASTQPLLNIAKTSNPSLQTPELGRPKLGRPTAPVKLD